MKKLVSAGLVLTALVLTAVPAQAGLFRRRCCAVTACCAPVTCCAATTACCVEACCAPTIKYEERKVTCYRPEWKEREVTYTVNRMVPRVEVAQQKCTVMVPEWVNETRTCMVPVCKPKQVDRHVSCCKMVSTQVTDPCTGCCYTVCKPVAEVRTVSCTVLTTEMVQKEYTVRVCKYRPEEKVYETRRTVCDCKPEQVTRTERYCVMVAYEQTVKVPVCQ